VEIIMAIMYTTITIIILEDKDKLLELLKLNLKLQTIYMALPKKQYYIQYLIKAVALQE